MTTQTARMQIFATAFAILTTRLNKACLRCHAVMPSCRGAMLFEPREMTWVLDSSSVDPRPDRAASPVLLVLEASFLLFFQTASVSLDFPIPSLRCSNIVRVPRAKHLFVCRDLAIIDYWAKLQGKRAIFFGWRCWEELTCITKKKKKKTPK